MKIYARMCQENEEDQLIIFFIPRERLIQLQEICVSNGLSEACLDMPTYVRHAWPEAVPTDGFVSTETRKAWEQGWFADNEFSDHRNVDLSQSLLELLHVGANGAIHIECRGGPAGEWWSEGIDLKEIAAYAEV